MVDYVLPLKPDNNLLLCINTHMLNNIPGNINTVSGSLRFLTSMAYGGLGLSSQIYARDFIILKNDKNVLKSNKKENSIEDYYIYNKEVFAIGDGEVVSVINGVKDKQEANTFQLTGNTVVIKHSMFLYSMYCHLKNDSIKNKIGDSVNAGQCVGNVGCSGNSSEPHLHFQLSRTNPIIVKNYGLIGIPKELNIFDNFNCVDLTNGTNGFLFDTGVATGKIDLVILLNNYKSSKIITTNTLPHLGFIINSKLSLENYKETIPLDILQQADKDPFLQNIIEVDKDKTRVPIYHGKEIAGFYTPRQSEYKKRMYWRTGAIYILPQYRKMGLASKAITEFFSDKEYGLAFIEPHNTASLATFEMCGFKRHEIIIGKRTNDKFWRMLKEPELKPAFLSW